MEYVSPSCERVTGYLPEEFINKPELIKNIILPQYQEAWLKSQQDMLFDTTLRQMEFQIKSKNGDIIWIEHAGQQIIDESGKYHGYRNGLSINSTKKRSDFNITGSKKEESNYYYCKQRN